MTLKWIFAFCGVVLSLSWIILNSFTIKSNVVVLQASSRDSRNQRFPTFFIKGTPWEQGIKQGKHQRGMCCINHLFELVYLSLKLRVFEPVIRDCLKETVDIFYDFQTSSKILFSRAILSIIIFVIYPLYHHIEFEVFFIWNMKLVILFDENWRGWLLNGMEIELYEACLHLKGM